MVEKQEKSYSNEEWKKSLSIITAESWNFETK